VTRTIEPPVRVEATTSTPLVRVPVSPSVTVTSAPPAAVAATRTSSAPASPPTLSVFEVQLALDRLALSPGSLDGAMGFRTRNALRAFQDRERLRPTGELDAATRRRLPAVEAPHTNYVVTPADLKRLMPLGKSWLDKWHQPRLDYETVLELVAEKSHAHPDLIRRLNPDVRWDDVAAGTRLTVPNVFRTPVTDKAAFARIRLGDRTLQVFGDQTNLLAHFPCSIARKDEKRPVGELKVAMAVAQPNYTFDPANFPNSPEALQSSTKLILAPGPNNPVGVVWIGLDKEGYGIHGAPHPEQVGQPESLGCFRLANWNAEYFLQFVWVGMPVVVEP
jgi:lipoprotein-anchoring transpeptidase ErfK/SrfK